jgi:uncharacterized membrane protein
MPKAARHRLKPVRIIRNHVRLVASFLIGAVILMLLPAAWPLSTRILVSWDSSSALYLVLAFIVMSRFDLDRVRHRACEEDEGGALVLALTVTAAIASLAATVIELGPVQKAAAETKLISFGLAAVTIMLSWMFIHVIFALYYAHQYYGEGDYGEGLDFPGDERINKPDYWDFLYFSLVVGMTSQVSDVQVTSKIVRRVVSAHSVVSFFFNVAILALTVNLAAGLI